VVSNKGDTKSILGYDLLEMKDRNKEITSSNLGIRIKVRLLG